MSIRGGGQGWSTPVPPGKAFGIPHPIPQRGRGWEVEQRFIEARDATAGRLLSTADEARGKGGCAVTVKPTLLSL